MPIFDANALKTKIKAKLTLPGMKSLAENYASKLASTGVSAVGKTPMAYADEVWQKVMEAKNNHFIGVQLPAPPSLGSLTSMIPAPPKLPTTIRVPNPLPSLPTITYPTLPRGIVAPKEEGTLPGEPLDALVEAVVEAVLEPEDGDGEGAVVFASREVEEDMWSQISDGICEFLEEIVPPLVSTGGSMDWKDSCRVVSTHGNITLSGLQQIDGVNVKVGNRVLVADQDDSAANGVYVAGTGAWERSEDGMIMTSGWTCYISEGDEYSKTYWVCITTDPITVGTTDIDLVKWNSVATANAVDWKESVRAASGIDEVLSGLRTVGGVTLVGGNRVLLYGQSDATKNGLWTAYSGAWIRTPDADRSSEVTCGLTVYVEEGTDEKKYFTLTTYNPITLGTTELTFQNVMGGGGGETLTFQQEDFTYTSTREFTLSASPKVKSETVYVNGVRIKPTVNYTVAGTTLTIAEGYYLESGFEVGVHYCHA